MCGISGIYANCISDRHIHIVKSLINNQTGRGPDHQAMEIIKAKQSQAIFGHNRLSIIDLSDKANQPMWDTTGRYCIVYNGEIYNYVELRDELKSLGAIFRTSSDTEVILNAFLVWGIDALNRFYGPFAFALFDMHSEQLWLCRDRFGIRPLYYSEVNNELCFASTTPILAKKLNLKPNLSYISKGLKYLVYEDGSDVSAYNNIFSLPSGSYLHCKFNNNGTLSKVVNKYYHLGKNVENLIDNLSLNNIDDLLQQTNDKFEKSVQIRLRSDVPLGISLSGGLDSSSVAALVSKHHNNTIGFSFGHPGNNKTEGPLVSKCAEFLNIHIEYIWPTQNEMIEALNKTIEIQDAPFSTFSIVAQYLLYKHVRSSGVKVLLGGQGGDEAFMGYKKYLLFWIQKSLKQKKYFKAAKNLLQMLPNFPSEISTLKNYWRHRYRYLRDDNHSTSALHLPESHSLCLNSLEQDLWKRQMKDILHLSLPTLLRYEDRNAMSNSVESRLPYMDHQLIELGLALPESIKLRGGYGKWAIRKIMKNKIPNEIRLARYKRGFDIPLASLLKSGLGKSIRESLNSNRKNIREFLKNPIEIDQIFSDYQLANRQGAMAEAISLMWLNKVLL